jgi:hypothetical protein
MKQHPKEQFEEAIDFENSFGQKLIHKEIAIKIVTDCQSIADEMCIDFGMWLLKNREKVLVINTSAELLSTFKKEVYGE